MNRTQLIWLLFALSGVVFLIGGLVNGDWFSIVASIPWLVGCAMALVDRPD